MRKRVSGATWLVISLGFTFLTVFSTFMIGAVGFDFDANDFPSSYYQEQIPYRQRVMAVSLAVPAVAALTAVAAIATRPRRWIQTFTAAGVLALALAAFVLCWVLGVDAVENARYFSQAPWG